MHISEQELLQIIQEEIKSELNEFDWGSLVRGARGLLGKHATSLGASSAGSVGSTDIGSAIKKIGTKAIKKRARRGMGQASSAYRKIPKKWVKCREGHCKHFECKGKCPPCEQDPFQTAIDKGQCQKIKKS